MPGDRKRVVVDIRGVNLDARAEGVDAHDFGDDDRQRVGLFAGGAAGAPDANRYAGSLVLEYPGDDVIPDVVPDRRIAEEARDVDQDRIEEGGVFVGVDLEVVGVIRV